MADRGKRIARWTERPPRTPKEAYQVEYREYRSGIIYRYLANGGDRATARSELAKKFFAVWGELPYGYVEPSPD